MQWVLLAVLVPDLLLNGSRFPVPVRAGIWALTAALVVAAGGPAGADVPEGWSNPSDVDPVEAVLLLVGVPLLLFLVITALVVIPGIIKGERFTPGGQATQDQWFGGPSKGTAELPAPDNDESKAGGASGRW